MKKGIALMLVLLSLAVLCAGCTTDGWNAISSSTAEAAEIDFPAAVRYHKSWIMPPFGRFYTQARRLKACRF